MASRLVWIPVFPSFTLSEAVNLRESAGTASGPCANALGGSQAAPAAQAARCRNSRRFMGPPRRPNSQAPDYLIFLWTRKRRTRYHSKKYRPRAKELAGWVALALYLPQNHAE